MTRKHHADTDDALGRRVYRAMSSIHGQGCFARVAFAPGDWIGTYEGREVSEDGTHVLWIYDSDGRILVGRDGCNLLRWLNHSDDPNAEFDGFDLYARRAIAIDDEITFDYHGAC
ncbi:MAG: SET domain-containing protein-lysine N-methyltransferase [Sphingobacteriia bacterium]|nr:SET domain-containing protein-lysine N-methyltransferase [Sphingobacteriia bacterium]NCC39702.1 SET domain-containing protein-lysine N-methyltransferase [Gammaproteobacteria bacterium]